MPKLIDRLTVANNINTIKDAIHVLMDLKTSSDTKLDDADDDLTNLLNKYQLLVEDWQVTYDSFFLKDCVDDRAIEKETVKYADQYYGARMMEIISVLIPILAHERLREHVAALSSIKVRIQNTCRFSLGILPHEPFRNPLPSQLFFSQRYHASSFSGKSLREGVSGMSVDEVSRELREGRMPASYLRVNMYFAPFNGSLKPFVYNNRTWVAFSKAHVDANRVVPVMPNQDLLNRVVRLETDRVDPNFIVDEDATGHIVPTQSMRPGRN